MSGFTIQLRNRLSGVAKKRNLRVFIRSHNPASLDALPEDAAPNVVFCSRRSKTGSSRPRRLMDISDYPVLIAQGRSVT